MCSSDLIENDSQLKLSTLYDRNASEDWSLKDVLIAKSMDELLDSSDVVIDFSIASATQELLSVAIKNSSRSAIIIGTTGLDSECEDMIDKLSKNRAILQATNMSRGVAILNKIVEIVSKSLPDFDIEISEIHHKHKKDSPSGTAMTQIGRASCRERVYVLV